MAATISENPIPKGFVPIPGSERRPAKSAKLLGPADPGETFKVTIVLRRRADGPPFPNDDYFVNPPPGRRRRPHPEEFAAKWGAHPTDITRVVDFAQAQGLTVLRTHACRRTVEVSGTVEQMGKAFGMTLGRYEYTVVQRPGVEGETQAYRGRDGFIHIPADLTEAVVGVFGLDNRNITKCASMDPPNTARLTVQTVTGLYNFPSNPANLTQPAAGQNIAICSFGGYVMSDLQAFFGVPNPPVSYISIDAVNNGKHDHETTQDICIAGAAAPGASIVVYFFSGSQGSWVELIHRVVHPEQGDLVCQVLSSSDFFGRGDDPTTLLAEGFSVSFVNAMHAALQDAALNYVTYCVASGDSGTDTTGIEGDELAHVLNPASDPYSLACGGTTIGDIQGPLFDEYVWNDNSGATGGGVSGFFPVPSYQQNLPVLLSLNNGQPGRCVPDIAGNASKISGYIVNGFDGNGTSAVAPLYAGLVARLNAILGEPVGFLNPTLYALNGSVCNDVNPYATPQVAIPGVAPPYGPTNNTYGLVNGYNAGPGWDACTGWGSLDGTKLLTALQNGTGKACTIILNWPTFVEKGVQEMVSQQGGSVNTQVSFPDAFVVVAEGFTSEDLGIGSPSPVIPQITLFLENSSTLPPGMSAQLAGGAVAESPAAAPGSPQQFQFTYQIVFKGTAAFPASADQIETVNLTATITGVSGVTATGSATISLTSSSAPFIVTGSNPSLSADLRVFQVQSGNSLAGVTMGYTGNAPNDATSFIQALLTAFNSVPPPQPHPFDSLATSEQASELTLGTVAVFNFAVARVSYQDLAVDAENVRVFFRLFPYMGNSAGYDPTTTYRRWSDGVEFGQTVPLLGSQLLNIPFFAQPRIDATQQSMTTQTDIMNVQTLTHDPTGGTSYAYYGCWLDTNQPSQVLFPKNPSGDGPFNASENPLVSIMSLLNDGFPCLTVEISYDPVPIAPGATPASSNRLGQRNLEFQWPFPHVISPVEIIRTIILEGPLPDDPHREEPGYGSGGPVIYQQTKP